MNENGIGSPEFGDIWHKSLDLQKFTALEIPEISWVPSSPVLFWKGTKRILSKSFVPGISRPKRLVAKAATLGFWNRSKPNEATTWTKTLWLLGIVIAGDAARNPTWLRTKTSRRMNIGTSRRCGPSIGEKKVSFSGLRSVLPFIGIFWGGTLVCLGSQLEFETSIYQFESARKLLAEPGAGTSARSLLVWICFSERHCFELSQVQTECQLGQFPWFFIAKGVK